MRFTLVISLSLLGWVSAAGDVVHLKDGKTIEGQTEDRGDDIQIRTVTGANITLPKSVVVEVEKTRDPRLTYLDRLWKLKADDAEGYFKLALWCDEHQLTEPYAAMLRKTLEIAPEHAEARKRLYSYDKFERPLPDNEEKAKRLLHDCGPLFKAYRTPHYLICHDCDDAFVIGRGRLFERVYEKFYRFFEQKGFTLDVIKDRLGAILLNSHAEYAKFLQVRLGGHFGVGIYSHDTNLIYFYNAVNNAALEQHRKETYSIPAGRLSREDRWRLAQEKKAITFVEKQLADQNITMTIHEATHQLTFNLNLLGMWVQNPVWVVEGIAEYFEPPTEGQWEGPGRLNRGRLRTFRQLGYHPLLKDMICEDQFFAKGPLEAYASSWALTYYLLEERPKEFADYLRRLRAKPARVPISPEERLADFAACFGNDFAEFDSRWEAFMEKLK